MWSVDMPDTCRQLFLLKFVYFLKVESVQIGTKILICFLLVSKVPGS